MSINTSQDRSADLFIYAPIVAALLLIGMGTVILLASTVGGPLGELHVALRGVLTPDERAAADPAQLTSLAQTRRPLLPVGRAPAQPMVAALPLTATLPITAPLDASCAAIHFASSLGIEAGYLSFGRFNTVTSTDPYGQQDPLTAWKLLQFGGFAIAPAAGGAYTRTLPINQTVNLLISDPYSGEMLFSARWYVDQIEISGRRASINAALQPNLSGLGVNNVIDSPVLDSLSAAGRGVLVLGFEYEGDLDAALSAGQAIYAPANGVIYPDRCLR